jgi:ribosomal 30S subunit maturation factor RimM
MTEANLIGAPIYSTDDETIGSISHLHALGAIQQVVVDGGGFLGIGSKPVALPMASLTIAKDAGDMVGVRVNATKSELEAMPDRAM